MIPVWKALEDKGIAPGAIDGASRQPWQPSALADEDESDEEGTQS